MTRGTVKENIEQRPLAISLYAEIKKKIAIAAEKTSSQPEKRV